jgi:hypothetical protein
MKADGIDALLFDLGGVVIDIDFSRAFARWAQHASCDEALVRERFLLATLHSVVTKWESSATMRTLHACAHPLR